MMKVIDAGAYVKQDLFMDYRNGIMDQEEWYIWER
jgi:hypothetical protein